MSYDKDKDEKEPSPTVNKAEDWQLRATEKDEGSGGIPGPNPPPEPIEEPEEEPGYFYEIKRYLKGK